MYKRPCQNVLIQGQPMCKYVATWEVVFHGAQLDKRFCDHHVVSQVSLLAQTCDIQEVRQIPLDTLGG